MLNKQPSAPLPYVDKGVSRSVASAGVRSTVWLSNITQHNLLLLETVMLDVDQTSKGSTKDMNNLLTMVLW